MQDDSLNKKKVRSNLIDNIKGVLIISVITAHYLRIGGSFSSASLGGVLYIISFSFIMQGFLFFSGYFSKNVQKCRDGAVKNFLVPYVLMMPIAYGVRYAVFGHAKLDFFMPTFALWFMLVIFVYRLSIKTLSKIPFILPISFASLLLSGCTSYLGIEFALGRIFSFLFFFILGYKCEQKHIDKVRAVPKIYGILVLILLIAFSAFMAYSGIWDVRVWHMKECYAASGLGIAEGMIARLVLTLSALGWIAVFVNLLPEKKNILSTIGRNTMTVYLLHIPVRYIIKGTGVAGHGNAQYYVIILALAAVTVYVFSRPVFSKGYDAVLYFVYDILILGMLNGCRKIVLKVINSKKGSAKMIRKATKKDIDAVARIYEAILDQDEALEEKRIGWVRGVYPTADTATEALNKGTLFVCEDNGKVVAAAKLDQEQVPEYAKCDWEFDAPDDEVMVMHTLVVHPEESGKGYGKTFLEFYEKYSLENGCRYLRIDTNKKNTTAREMYTKRGYKEIAIVPCEFNGIPDVWLVCLEKKL